MSRSYTQCNLDNEHNISMKLRMFEAFSFLALFNDILYIPAIAG